MTDNNKFLENNDVVHFKSYCFDFDKTSKIEQIKGKINQWIKERFKSGRQIFPDFIDNCEVLKADGKGWQKGKIRIRFEFIPYEPNPEEEIKETKQKSLDEFRN
ncbi:MAG: KGK domain-containing protein [Halothece sp.]